MRETLESDEKFKVKLEASSSVGMAVLDKYGNFRDAAKSIVELEMRAVGKSTRL